MPQQQQQHAKKSSRSHIVAKQSPSTPVVSAPHLLASKKPTETPDIPLKTNQPYQKQQVEKHNENTQVKGDPNACLFVASLNASMSDDHLQEGVTNLFSKYGDISNVKVLQDWANRPYAFVQFKRREDAERALVGANQAILDERPIRIERAHVNRTLFIAKFSKNLNEEEMKDALSISGEIESFTLLKDMKSGESKGCGFAKYKFREDAISAYTNLKTNSKWVVEWAGNLEKDISHDKTSIFIGNLAPDAVTEQILRQKFGKHGTITSLDLKKKNFGDVLYAFALIKYENESEAQVAIAKENGAEWLGKNIKVQLKESDSSKAVRLKSGIQRRQRSTSTVSTASIPYIFAPFTINEASQVIDEQSGFVATYGVAPVSQPPIVDFSAMSLTEPATADEQETQFVQPQLQQQPIQQPPSAVMTSAGWSYVPCYGQPYMFPYFPYVPPQGPGIYTAPYTTAQAMPASQTHVQYSSEQLRHESPHQ